MLVIPSVFADEVAYEPIGDRIAKEAAHWIGSPYGTSDGCEGYGSEVDCSGLVLQVYKAFGIELPRNSALQAKVGELVQLNEMIAGDIVCFMYEDGSIGHVGIYIGGNSMIHSPRPEKTVEISSYFEDWGSIKAVYGRRIAVESDYIPEQLPEELETQVLKSISTPNSLRMNHLEGIDYMPKVDINDPMELILQIGNPVMTVNGEDKPIDESGEVFPIIVNNRTLLPLRKVAEEFGAEVNWIGGENGEINIKYGEYDLTLWIGQEYIMSNGISVTIDSAPVILEGRTYLPIKFIADEFGWNVDWNDNEKTVTLSANQDAYYDDYYYNYGYGY